jgi:hypothetical protein
VVWQWLAVAAVLVASIIDLMGGRAWAATLAASATVILLLSGVGDGLSVTSSTPLNRAT